MKPSRLQIEAHDAYRKCGLNLSATAKLLGKDRRNLKKILFDAHLNGLTIPTQYCKHLPAGMKLDKASIYVGKDGKTAGWYKGSSLQHSPEELESFLEQRIPISKVKVPKVKAKSDNYMLLWPVYDAHHGMLAWARETGNDYDHKISRHLQESAAKIIFSSFAQVKRVVLVLGGDNQTADNRSGLTEQSHHTTDRDTRFGKMVWCVYETSIASIELAAQFAEEVYVIVLSGNHDWHSAIWLSIALNAHFRDKPNITIDTAVEKHRFFRWGSTVFMATHGDTDPRRAATYALQQVLRRGMAREGDVERVRVLMGHLHRKQKIYPNTPDEIDGVIVERFPTLAAQEAYAVESSYSNCRATEVQLWHSKYGSHRTMDVTVGEILERFPVDKFV